MTRDDPRLPSVGTIFLATDDPSVAAEAMTASTDGFDVLTLREERRLRESGTCPGHVKDVSVRWPVGPPGGAGVAPQERAAEGGRRDAAPAAARPRPALPGEGAPRLRRDHAEVAPRSRRGCAEVAPRARSRAEADEPRLAADSQPRVRSQADLLAGVFASTFVKMALQLGAASECTTLTPSRAQPRTRPRRVRGMSTGT